MRFLTHYIGRFAVALLFGLVAIMSEFAAGQTEKPSGIRVVAAENTYGDLFSQIGGSHVRVLSILSDPNVDPHEYESNVSDARAIADCVSSGESPAHGGDATIVATSARASIPEPPSPSPS